MSEKVTIEMTREYFDDLVKYMRNTGRQWPPPYPNSEGVLSITFSTAVVPGPGEHCDKCNWGRIDGGYCDCKLGRDLKSVETLRLRRA